MKRFITVGLLIGVLFIYGSYSLISGSDNNTVNAPDSSDFIRTYKLLDNKVNSNKLDTDKDVTNNKGIIKKEEDTDDGQLNTVTIISGNKKASLEQGDNSGKAINTVEESGKERTVKNAVLSNSASDGTEMITNDGDKKPIISEASLQTDEKNNHLEKISLVEKISVHRVKKGENLWEIANKYNIDIDTLIGANDITNMNKIQVGDQIKILPIKGILYKVNPGESLWTITRKFDISIDAVVEANALVNPDLVKPGMSLILPGAKPEFGYRDRLGKKFIKPINARISSYFGPRWGKMHEGIDWAVNTGTKVKAARAGKVIYAEWASGYGYTVVIEHQKGVRTLYAHNSKLLVRGGQWVERGQTISLSGNTGRSTGPHLHFEIQINGKPVNPLNYIQ